MIQALLEETNFLDPFQLGCGLALTQKPPWLTSVGRQVQCIPVNPSWISGFQYHQTLCSFWEAIQIGGGWPCFPMVLFLLGWSFSAGDFFKKKLHQGAFNVGFLVVHCSHPCCLISAAYEPAGWSHPEFWSVLMACSSIFPLHLQVGQWIGWTGVWRRTNKLKINLDKTETLLVGGSLDKMDGRLPALEVVTLPLK